MRKALGITLYWKGLLLVVSLLLSFQASSYAANVTLQWDANTEPDLDGYRVYYKTGSSGNRVLSAYDGSGLVYLEDTPERVVDSGFEIKKEDLPDPDGDTVTCRLSGLSASETYYFVVTAYDDEGLESEASNEVATCSVAAPIVTGETPTNNTTPTWTWNSGEGEGTGTFRYNLDNSDLTSDTTDTSYTPDTELSEGSHTLYVQEQDNDGRWSSSGSFTILIDTTEPTSSATDLTYENGATISIDWSASDTTSGVASTELWYKGPGGTWANTGLDAQTGESGTFSYSHTGEEEVEEGTYSFATRSTDNAGNVEEEPSGEGDISYTITTPEPTPAPSPTPEPTPAPTFSGQEADGGGCFIATVAFGSR